MFDANAYEKGTIDNESSYTDHQIILLENIKFPDKEGWKNYAPIALYSGAAHKLQISLKPNESLDANSYYLLRRKENNNWELICRNTQNQEIILDVNNTDNSKLLTSLNKLTDEEINKYNCNDDETCERQKIGLIRLIEAIDEVKRTRTTKTLPAEEHASGNESAINIENPLTKWLEKDPQEPDQDGVKFKDEIKNGTLNVHLNHWEKVLIIPIKDDETGAISTTRVIYVNPLGSSMPPELRKFFTDEYGSDNLDIIEHIEALQNDGHNCGLYTLMIAEILYNNIDKLKQETFSEDNLKDLLAPLRYMTPHELRKKRQDHQKLIGATGTITFDPPKKAAPPEDEKDSALQKKWSSSDTFHDAEIIKDLQKNLADAGWQPLEHKSDANGKPFYTVSKKRGGKSFNIYEKIVTSDSKDYEEWRELAAHLRKAGMTHGKAGITHVKIIAADEEAQKIIEQACIDAGMTHVTSEVKGKPSTRRTKCNNPNPRTNSRTNPRSNSTESPTQDPHHEPQPQP